MNHRTRFWMPLLLAGALLLPQAASAFDASMTLTADGADIEGCDTRQEREGTIPVLALSQAVQVPYDPGSGGPTGNRQHAPLQVRIAASCGSTPLLYKALTQNEAIEATIRLYEPSQEGGQDVHSFSIELRQAHVTAITMVGVGGSEGGSGDLLVSFSYGHIIWTYEPTGTTHEDDWKDRA